MRKQKSKGSTKVNIVPILIYSFIGITIFGLIIYVTNLSYTKITSANTRIKALETQNNTLQEKVDDLKSIDSTILGKSEDVVLALPEDDPALLSIYEIRKKIDENDLIMSKVGNASVGGKEKESYKNGGLDFAIDGDLDSILKFLLSTKEILPIVNIKSVTYQLSVRAGFGSESNITFLTYWSALPTEIPPINEPIKSLSSDEEDLLSEISKYEKPDISTLEPEGPYEREDPFR